MNESSAEQSTTTLQTDIFRLWKEANLKYPTIDHYIVVSFLNYISVHDVSFTDFAKLEADQASIADMVTTMNAVHKHVPNAPVLENPEQRLTDLFNAEKRHVIKCACRAFGLGYVFKNDQIPEKAMAIDEFRTTHPKEWAEFQEATKIAYDSFNTPKAQGLMRERISAGHDISISTYRKSQPPILKNMSNTLISQGVSERISDAFSTISLDF